MEVSEGRMERYYCAAGHPCEAADRRVEELDEQASLIRRLCMEYGWDSECDLLVWLKARCQRVEELEREKDKQTALAEHRRQRIELLEMHPSVAICQEERVEGNGGCGACALCCKEQRERAEAAEAEVRRLEGQIVRLNEEAFILEAERIREREGRNG